MNLCVQCIMSTRPMLASLYMSRRMPSVRLSSLQGRLAAFFVQRRGWWKWTAQSCRTHPVQAKFRFACILVVCFPSPVNGIRHVLQILRCHTACCWMSASNLWWGKALVGRELERWQVVESHVCEIRSKLLSLSSCKLGMVLWLEFVEQFCRITHDSWLQFLMYLRHS